MQIELPLGIATRALTVPTRAVRSLGREESYVYIVDKDSRASYRKVRPLLEHGDRTALDGEIAEGDRIVVDGQAPCAGPAGQNTRIKGKGRARPQQTA